MQNIAVLKINGIQDLKIITILKHPTSPQTPLTSIPLRVLSPKEKEIGKGVFERDFEEDEKIVTT